jgi:hypothetical protein
MHQSLTYIVLLIENILMAFPFIWNTLSQTVHKIIKNSAQKLLIYGRNFISGIKLQHCFKIFP